METVDWRAPGSHRSPAVSSWSPLTESREPEPPDPYLAAPAQARPAGPLAGRDLLGLVLRPGIVPMRPLGLGDVFGGVVRAIRGNVGSTMGLAAGTTAVFLVPTTALAAWLSGAITYSSTDVALGSLAGYIPSVGSWLSSILLAGFMAYVVGQGVLGRRVTASETLARTVRRLGGLFLATLLIVGSAAVLGGGAVAAVVLLGMSSGSSDAEDGLVLLSLLVLLPLTAVGVLVLQTYFSFTTPALVLERLSAPRAIGRSWRLVGPPSRSGFWRVLGIRLLASTVAGVVGQIVATPLSFVAMMLMAITVGDGLGSWYLVGLTVLQGLVAMMTGILTTPFIAGVDAVLYMDARIRKEALDVQLLHATQDRRTSRAGVVR